MGMFARNTKADVDVTGGDGGWYLGEATKEITIVLKEKKEEIKK